MGKPKSIKKAGAADKSLKPKSQKPMKAERPEENSMETFRLKFQTEFKKSCNQLLNSKAVKLSTEELESLGKVEEIPHHENKFIALAKAKFTGESKEKDCLKVFTHALKASGPLPKGKRRSRKRGDKLAKKQMKESEKAKKSEKAVKSPAKKLDTKKAVKPKKPTPKKAN